MIKKIFLGCFSAFFAFGTNVVFAQNAKSEYQGYYNFAGATSNFKIIQTPNSLPIQNLGTNYQIKTIYYQIPDTAPEKLKFFLPPGTVAINAGMFFFLADQQGKGVIKLNNPPETPLENVNPSNVFTTENLGGSTGRAYDETILRNLINQKEVRYFSEGGRANFMVLSSPNNLIEPMTTGGYIYGNFQYPGGRLQRAEWRIFVKADCYEQWFNSPTTAWDTLGNPDENATHTCAGSSGGTLTPPELTGITLSRAVWNAATDANNTTITVKPQPAGAVLPACTASPSNLLTAGSASPTEALFNIIPSAVTAATPAVTLTCGSQSQTLDLQPVGTVATLQNIVVPTESKAELQVTLKHTDAEVAEKKPIIYWVGTLLPKYPSFSQDENWYFLSTSSASPISYQWEVFTGSPLEFKTVAFTKNLMNPIKNSIEAEKLLSIPLGYDASEFKALNAKIYIGYRQGNGIFKNLGVIWDASGYSGNMSVAN